MPDPVVSTPAPEQADYSVSQLRAMFDGKEPEATPVVEPTAEEPKVEVAQETEETPEASAEADVKTAPESESGDDTQERDEHGKFKAKDDLPVGVQKRIEREISRAQAARKAAEAELEAIKAERAKTQVTEPATKPEPAKAEEGEPKLDDFETYDQYIDAKAKYVVKQTLAAERAEQAKQREADAQTARVAEWNGKVAEFKKAHSDYNDLVDDLTAPVPLQMAVIESEAGPALAYYLAKPENEAVLAKLVSLAGNSPAMYREIGRLEAKILTPVVAPPVTKKITSAAKPAVPLSGATPKTFDLSDGSTSMKEWKREFAKSLQTR